MITAKLLKYLISLILIIFVYFTAIAQTSIAAPAGTVFHPNPVIGLVDGKPVTFEDVRNKKANDLSLQLYQHLSVRLMEYALEKLAAKHQEIVLTPERKVALKDIIAVYEQNNLQERGTLEQVRPQIKQFLEQQIRGRSDSQRTDNLPFLETGRHTPHTEYSQIKVYMTGSACYLECRLGAGRKRNLAFKVLR